jgi:hypothetical protein
LYRHGLMASVSRIRHTVLRLIGAQGLRGFRNPFTGHSLDQRLVQRGKKRACAPVLRRLPRQSPQRPTACANVGPDTPKGPRGGRPPHGARTAPGGAAGQAGTAGRTDTEPSCVGPRPWLPVKSPRGRGGSTSVWAQTYGASSQSVQYSGFACGRIIGHPLQPAHYF